MRVYAHSWRTAEPGHVWESDGSGKYTIEEAEGQRRGCKIVVEIKDDCCEFSLASKIEASLKRYSSFVPFPVNLNGKRINTIQAIWLRNKNEIKEEEYTRFLRRLPRALPPRRCGRGLPLLRQAHRRRPP